MGLSILQTENLWLKYINFSDLFGQWDEYICIYWWECFVLFFFLEFLIIA
jgi:hypothetical protein